MVGSRPARASILTVEPDPTTARVLIDALEMVDYRVWHATDGREARALAERARPDLILLDLVLPDIDGLVLCSVLKAATDAPIIICSATSRRGDPVLALKLGADDFVRKPFEVDDLLARIEAILRRRPPAVSRGSGEIAAAFMSTRPAEVRLGDLRIEPNRRRAALADTTLTLTPTEFRLLTVLATHADSVLTRDRLAQEVWGYADASNGRTIDVHIRRLRVKLAQATVPGPAIVSVRGMGYRIAADENSIPAA